MIMILLLLALASFIASLTVFPVIVGVKSGRIKKGFIFFGYTAVMYVFTTVISIISFNGKMFWYFNRILGDAFWFVSGVLYAVLVFVITYKLVLKKILFNKEKNLVLGAAYSVAVSYSVTFFYAFMKALATT